jgi:hypothetical protein
VCYANRLQDKINLPEEAIMVQPAQTVTGGNNYVYAPGTILESSCARGFADPLETFQVLFNDGGQLEPLSTWERLTHFTPRPVRVLKQTKWETDVDRAKRYAAGFLAAGKLPQAVRASYALGDVYWSHFLIHHAEIAYFYGAALSIGEADLAVLNLGDESLRDELFAGMMAAGVAEMQSAPEELGVGDQWPVFTPLLHGGQYGAKTQKYAGLNDVRREFRHNTPVQGSVEGTTVITPITPEQAQKARDGEIETLRKIEAAGIRVPTHLFPTGLTAYVRSFVEGEPLDNLPYAATQLSAEQLIAAKVGYYAMVLKGVRGELWKTEPSLLKQKAIYEIGDDRSPESEDNWVIIEPA